AVAGRVDEHAAAYRGATRLGLDEYRVDAVLVGHHDADGERVKEDSRPGADHQLVRGDLVRRDVVRLRGDAVVDGQVRRRQAVQLRQAVEQLVGETVDHQPMLAVHLGVQPAEGTEPASGTGTAQK